MGYLTLFLSIRAAAFGERRAWLAPWKSGATIGFVALALAAGKLLPTFALLSKYPRVFTPIEQHGVPEIFNGFFVKYGLLVVIGLVALALADKIAAMFAGGAVLAFALAMGDFSPKSPFHLLKMLPMFSQLRFPDRYAVLILFFVAVCAARGITRLEDTLPRLVRGLWDRWFAWRRRPARAVPAELAWLVVGLSTFLAYRTLRPEAEAILEQVRIKPATMMVSEAPRNFDQPFRQSRGNRRDAHIFPTANMGSIYCVAGNPLPQSALLRGDLPQEEYPVRSHEGHGDPQVVVSQRDRARGRREGADDALHQPELGAGVAFERGHREEPREAPRDRRAGGQVHDGGRLS